MRNLFYFFFPPHVSAQSIKLTFRKARWKFTLQDLRSPTQSATGKQ